MREISQLIVLAVVFDCGSRNRMRYGDNVGIDILVHEHLFTASYSIVIHVYHGQAGMALDL